MDSWEQHDSLQMEAHHNTVLCKWEHTTDICQMGS
ncbi:hypothetical protein NC653_036442 [Populus alba x Populus x berolinensis]|uniref:Uncharacterized protein n=1 Tax=Populus alba x Populus x berolinensis TaxID=444605 RepID=A0AAD6PUN7_9ROSI|nr:hypothetical protein NC653_036442 [Populus alba x Populus x berolinensis]